MLKECAESVVGLKRFFNWHSSDSFLITRSTFLWLMHHPWRLSASVTLRYIRSRGTPTLCAL
jgi:hypothetical protein